jgi:hypothetical protein
MRQRTAIYQAIQELEKKGLLVKTGEYRRNRQGVFEPVYVTREIYEQMNNNRIREAESGAKPSNGSRPRSDTSN